MTGLKRPLRPPDGSDTHTARPRADLTPARAAYEVARGQLPPWVSRAMTICNRVVGRMGPSTPTMDLGNGKGMADLPIVTGTDDTNLLGPIDRYLAFPLRTCAEADTARLTTRIWFNQWTGRLCPAVVLIHQKRIVRFAIGRLA